MFLKQILWTVLLALSPSLSSLGHGAGVARCEVSDALAPAGVASVPAKVSAVPAGFALATAGENVSVPVGIDALLSYVVRADSAAGRRALATFEREMLPVAADTVRCDYLYARGLYSERFGSETEAAAWYRRHVRTSDSLRRYDVSFFDATLKTMLFDENHALADEAVELGLASTGAPAAAQRKFSFQYRTYIVLVQLLNANGWYVAVPPLAVQGMDYVRAQVAPGSDDYYALPFCEAVAWGMMGQTARADSVCQRIDRMASRKSDDLRQGLEALRRQIAWSRANPPEERKLKSMKAIDDSRQKLLFVNSRTAGGSKLFHEYFDYVRRTLKYTCFDAGSVSDEQIWRRCLASMMSLFYVCCDSLPGRESEAYDNVLVRKDFLSMHTARGAFLASGWRDVERHLSAGEAAIEVCCMPDEMLIVRPGFARPRSVPVDSALFDDVVALLDDEPLSVARLYESGGPLSRLWQTLEPELHGVETLYISGANVFTQINYAAIALPDGRLVGDKYRVRLLLSTSSAGRQKAAEGVCRSAALFGAVDYERAEYDAPRKADLKSGNALAVNENALAVNENALADNENALADSKKGLAVSDNALAVKDNALADNEKNIAGKSKNIAGKSKNIAGKFRTFPDEPWHLTRGLPAAVRSGFSPLPGSGREIHAVDSMMGLHHVARRLYTGARATEEALKALSGQAPEVLQISTHGFMLAPLFNDHTGSVATKAQNDYKTVLSQSGLLFSGANRAWRDLQTTDRNDGILTSRELMQLDLRGCRLAVLSACRSALGETRNMTGLSFGVAYALKQAGVEQVMCSLWTIDDRATCAFMTRFYHHYLRSGNAHEALQQAQSDLRNTDAYRSPYYWASFVIVE